MFSNGVLSDSFNWCSEQSEEQLGHAVHGEVDLKEKNGYQKVP